MRDTDKASVIEGPEPPVAALAGLDPREAVPPALDSAVRAEIRTRLRAERNERPWWRRTAGVAALSAIGAAVATVALMAVVQPWLERDAAMTPKGVADVGTEVHLDFLVQPPGETAPARLEPGEQLAVGDAVYLRAELNQPGSLTFLAEEPGREWAPLVTQRGRVGANDLQRDGRLQVFYVTEAGVHRFAAVWSPGPPPGDWNPGAGEIPEVAPLGDDSEVAWVAIEAHRRDTPP